jgi:hypothetical protein
LQLEGSLQYLVYAAAVPGFQQDHSQVILELAVAGSARCGIAGQRKCGRVQALAVIYPAQCVRDVGIIGLSATATDVPAVALVPATTLPIRRGFAGGAGREGIDKPKVGRLQQLFVSPMHNNNRHNGHGSGLDSITPQLVMPDGRRFSSKQKPSNGLKGKRFENVPCLDSESTEQEAVAFRQFPDGTFVDLVRDPSKRRLQFLVWKDGTAKIQDNFQQADPFKKLREKGRVGTGLYGGRVR